MRNGPVDHRTRSRISCARPRLLVLLAVLVLAPRAAFAGVPAPTVIPHYDPSFLLLRDTLFVLDSTFVEVRLDRQTILQHFRDGRIRRYPCSTGNPRIKEAIATREGIFTIQWKSRQYMSKQFEVPLNYWMPFDGGIGIHGLQGRSYYRYLGRRASSHGCVRVSNETGAQIFRDSRRGTLVIVHSGSPARVLVFGDTSMSGLRVLDRIDGELLRDRLAAVEDSRAEDTLLAGRIAIRPGYSFASRIAVGAVDPRRVSQRRIPTLEAPAIQLKPGPLRLSEVRELRGRRPMTALELLGDGD